MLIIILRVPSATDRRALEIRLTEKGRRYEKIIEQCAHELNQFALNSFQRQEKTPLSIC